MAALAEVVGALVDDDRSTDDRVRAEERDVLVWRSDQSRPARLKSLHEAIKIPPRTSDLDRGGSGAVGLDVSEITNVSLRVLGSTVVLLQGVEVGTGGSASVATPSIWHCWTVAEGLTCCLRTRCGSARLKTGWVQVSKE